MEGQRFDNFVKGFAGRRSRRDVVKAMTAASGGAVALVATGDDAGARPTRFKQMLAAALWRKPCKRAADCPAGGACVNGFCGCPPGSTLCNGDNPIFARCVNLETDKENCGSCGIGCGDNFTCQKGVCGCEEPLDWCGEGGCTDVASDPSNCGKCGSICGEGLRCVFGVCACPSGETACQGPGGDYICRDITNDSLNCGSCGHLCDDNEHCQGGRCVCDSGFVECSGTCADINTDSNHCGKCGNVCDNGGSCIGGKCGCPDGKANCGDGCVDRQSDPQHCGQCNNACAPGESCVNGGCGCPGGEPTCSDVCCASDEMCYEGVCQRKDRMCLMDWGGYFLCDEGTICCHSECIPSDQQCCDEGMGACGNICCDFDQGCCDGQCCCFAEETACEQGDGSTTCCVAGTYCCNGDCIGDTELCCYDGKVSCNDEVCCSADQGCCGDVCCCAEGLKQCPDGNGGYICCNAGDECCDGACRPGAGPCCAEGEAVCDGQCLDIMSDRFNCGNCGHWCGDCKECISGTCVALECGYCETCRVSTNTCESCGTVCQACEEGACRPMNSASPDCESCSGGEIVVGEACGVQCCGPGMECCCGTCWPEGFCCRGGSAEQPCAMCTPPSHWYCKIGPSGKAVCSSSQ